MHPFSLVDSTRELFSLGCYLLHLFGKNQVLGLAKRTTPLEAWGGMNVAAELAWHTLILAAILRVRLGLCLRLLRLNSIGLVKRRQHSFLVLQTWQLVQ